MSNNRNSEGCKVVNFDFRRAVEKSSTVTREQLVTMIRKVLTPAELFKLNAPKHKREHEAEIIAFCNFSSEEKSNG